MQIYRFNDEFSYVRISEVPENEREELIKFMYGQTMPFIPGHDDAIFLWDYYTFKDFILGKKVIWD